MPAEDSGRNYVTNAVILEKLEHQSSTLNEIKSDVKCISAGQVAGSLDRETIRGRVKNLEVCSDENKEEHKAMKTRQVQFDVIAYMGSIISGILAAIGISK